ncbi:DUF664 domain-containing protein [Galactobacter valiniphilus]|uniref:DUF664 domain-containing protein n=2 Tax=Galactobacter valiniphilus TaxID=2676122 RepID=A0A399J9Y8_9MICC|nr:DUF664 domain-containing protein [Galactobacter valiniphilus]
MNDDELKDLLVRRYRLDRETLWQKASGLPEHLARTPQTPTGTNLLGLVKHVALVEAGYFGDCFGGPFPDPPAYYDYTNPACEPDDDLWAFPGESPADVFALARRAAAHADASIDRHALGDTARVAWWGEGGRDASLAELLVHMLDELARHLGQADIVHEQLDGSAGYRAGNSNLPEHRTAGEWEARRARLQAAADATRPRQHE